MDSSLFADFLGWCLALFLPVLAMVGPLRRDQSVAQAYLFVVWLHIAAAAIYVYLPGILPPRGDTHAFHWYAVLRQSTMEGTFGIGSLFYKEYLAQVYSLVGPSFFFGAILSIYAFAISVVVLVKSMELLRIRQGGGWIVLTFGALPTSVLYGTVPMREPYQVLFFMLACYSMLRFRLSSNPLHLIGAGMFAVMMGLLHKGLILYAPLLILIMLLVRVDNSASGSIGGLYLHRFAAVALAIGFVAWISGAGQRLEGVGGTEILLTAPTGEGLVEFTEQHRDEEALSKGRTAYGVALNTSSPVQFAYSLAMIFLYYMFTPFPWQIRNFLDVYAFGEVILRIACLVAIFRMWRRGGPVHPQIVTLLMVVYFSMAFLWAAGTTNYGTATRHHMVHQWILLLLGVPALIQMRSGFARAHATAAHAGAPRFSGSGGTRIQPRTPHLRSLVEASSPPRRLGVGACQPRSLQTANPIARPWSGGLARPRRLTEE